jgi:predicted RNA binding protein YcfA (HicA-like mRNA interferase family)
MPKLPRITAKQIIPVLESRGFSLDRQAGSHMIYKNSEGSRTVVPFHAGKTFPPKTLKSILRGAGISIEELIEAL